MKIKIKVYKEMEKYEENSSKACISIYTMPMIVKEINGKVVEFGEESS